jgi:transcriptional regulator with XRE-family HTH domain
MAETIGALIRRARTEAGLSRKEVAAAVGFSAPFLLDVESDRRRLVTGHWSALVRAVPSLSLRALAHAALATGPVEVDASDLAPEQRSHLARELERAAARAA